jgi:cellulose synthase/poly-beta-1,6-N-acetylglucosamine synthase-like glycosyltransferase
MCLAPLNKLKYRGAKFDTSYEPTFSLIVPAHNEENVIERTIKYFLKTDYPSDKKEIIIVNDGSKDKTRAVVARYASKIIDSETGIIQTVNSNLKNVILVNRKVGGKGKSYVSNDGRKYSSGEILFFIDADVRLTKNAFSMAARHFKSKNVGAVAGYVSVFGKKGMLNKFIDFESVTAQKIMRQGFDTIGVHYVIPGGCAIFRKEVLDEVNGYESDTLAEDTDITWRISTETDKIIRFDPSIVVIADEPTTLIGLWNQRVRWARGNIGVTFKHINKIGKPRYHKAATVAYPFWVANILAPVTFIFSLLGLILGILLNVNMVLVSIIGRFLLFSFLFILAAGIIVNKGKSWFGGFLAPGVPLLIILLSNLVSSDGIIGIVNNLGYSSYSSFVGIFFVFWMLFCVPGTWLSLKISKNHPKCANFLQLTLFGYWILLVSSVLYGYFKELRKDDLIWIRTER